MIWARASHHVERRIREFLLNESCCSETAVSLATKLGLSRKRCRRALDQLVDEGLVRRREFSDFEPIYYRYPDSQG
jgi:predicted ArsR family transcriptional regulator